MTEHIADLENQLATWRNIHRADQECIQALMGKSFDLTQHVIIPVEEYRRTENRLLDESKYVQKVACWWVDSIATVNQLTKEIEQLKAETHFPDKKFLSLQKAYADSILPIKIALKNGYDIDVIRGLAEVHPEVLNYMSAERLAQIIDEIVREYNV